MTRFPGQTLSFYYGLAPVGISTSGSMPVAGAPSLRRAWRAGCCARRRGLGLSLLQRRAAQRRVSSRCCASSNCRLPPPSVEM